MLLKLHYIGEDAGLNRTFYGIETCFQLGAFDRRTSLNRTFYGIETGQRWYLHIEVESLNRTFYGIETSFYDGGKWRKRLVLIVPFMELKQLQREADLVSRES